MSVKRKVVTAGATCTPCASRCRLRKSKSTVRERSPLAGVGSQAKVALPGYVARALATALGTGRGPDLVDPGVELLGEPLDIGERRPVVDRIDRCAAIARQEAP